ncbi:hypothetical protein, partial [Klebsiella pneumoniae]|uniref:hypothetical protein n=1 Tax=Klebsiella pneumoniae TaxID=573 RepID=UPI001D11EB93
LSLRRQLQVAIRDSAQAAKINAQKYAGAQCFPRLACPLRGSDLMQLQQVIGSAPALAAIVKKSG